MSAEREPRWSAAAKKTGGALPLVRIAAAVLLVLTPLLWMLASDLLDRGSASTAQREITTERGERLRLTLGDGCMIELGPARTLRIPAFVRRRPAAGSAGGNRAVRCGARCEAAFHGPDLQCGDAGARQHGLSYAEIAVEMGVSRKTVEIHLGRALKLLREELAPFLRP